MMTIPGCKFLENECKQNGMFPKCGISIISHCQAGGIRSHMTDEGQEPGDHLMDNGSLSMATANRGVASHKTDEGQEAGVHLMDNGSLSMPTAKHGLLGAVASNKIDVGCKPGEHFSNKLKRVTMPSFDRGSKDRSGNIGKPKKSSSKVLLLEDKDTGNSVIVLLLNRWQPDCTNCSCLSHPKQQLTK